MAEFDAYHKWLGIPKWEQPPNHYRLLGLTTFESDPDAIESAADRQMSHVRTFQSSQHSAESQKLLNELAAAKLCLLNSERKYAYETELMAKQRSPLVAPQAKWPVVEPKAVNPEPIEVAPPVQRRKPRIAVSEERSSTSSDRNTAGIIAAGVAGIALVVFLIYMGQSSHPRKVSREHVVTANASIKDDAAAAERMVGAESGRPSAKGVADSGAATEGAASENNPALLAEKVVASPALSLPVPTKAGIVLSPGVELGMVLIPGTTTMPALPANVHGDATASIGEFLIAESETTQKQWRAVLGSVPLLNDGDELKPVVHVSRMDVAKFVAALNQRLAKSGWRFRLPTTNEWFHAYLANRQHADYTADLSSFAWHRRNAVGGLQPVARLKANGFGLFDMLGNAWEFTTDKQHIFGGSYDQPPEDQAAYGIASEVQTDIRAANVSFRLAASRQAAGAPLTNDPNRVAILQTKIMNYHGDGRDFVRYDGQAFALGIGNDPGGVGFGMLGLELDGATSILLEVSVQGALRLVDANSFAGFFVDYHAAAGYRRRVALSIGLSSGQRGSPGPEWGRSAVPDRIVELPRTATQQLTLADWAPADWDGRVWFNVVLQNGGTDTGMTGRIVKVVGTETR